MLGLDINGWIKPGRIDAVEVRQLDDGSLLMHHLGLRHKGNHLRVLAVNPSQRSLEELADIIPQGVPVVLVLTGKKILIRNSTCNAEASNEELLKTVFPDSHLEDFLISREPLVDTGLVFCIARRNMAENIVKNFLGNKVQIADIFIGPLTVAHILPILNTVDSPIPSGHCLFYQTNGQLIDTRPGQADSTGELRVGELVIPKALLCAFSAAFEFIAINRNTPNTSLTLVREKAQEIIAEAKIKGILTIALAFLLVILSGNFLLFNYYRNRYTETALNVEQNLSFTQRSDSLKELINQREQFLRQSSNILKHKGSFIIDRISGILPAGILLTEISINPIRFKSEEVNKEPVYRTGIVLIRALVRESGALNKFINRLKGMEWVKSVAFSDYIEKEKNEAGVTLEITLK